MGLEAECRVTWGQKTGTGKARLEEKEIAFRGSFSLRIPLSDVKEVAARAGRLEVAWAGDSACFELGASAEKWALKIRYPRSRLDKLGVKPDSRVSVIGRTEATFVDELRQRTSEVVVGRARKGSNIVFLALDEPSGLARLGPLRAFIPDSGAVWVLWPKGRKSLREGDVRAAAREAGLVDVKVVSFSEALSGLKLVVPVARRAGKATNGKSRVDNRGQTV